MLRISCIMILCAVFFHVCYSRIVSRIQSEADDAKTREQLKKVFDELKELSQKSKDKYELGELSKMINTAGTKTVRFGKQYLRQIKNLITKKKETSKKQLNANRQRRFMNWFKTIFTPSDTTTTTPNVPRVNTEWAEKDVQLLETLNKLIDVINKLNETIKKSNNDTQAYYVVKVPVPVTDMNKNDEIKEIDAKASNNETDNAESKTGFEDLTNRAAVANVNRKRNKRDVGSPTIVTINEDSKNKTEDLQNDTTILDRVVTNVTNELLIRANTRRSFSPQNDIRSKLFYHLYDIFDDIKLKLGPVLRIKNGYSNNVAFKVGYISANLDTLGSNLARLRADMEENARAWSDDKVLELFDVLKVHHDVVARLLDSLRGHLNVKPEYSLS